MDIKKEYERWLANATADADVVAELKTLDDAKIEDAFYRDLAFGTGGLRGVIGAGTNRMNIYTVAKASQGLADYLKKNFETPSVAIGYDSRIKSDVFAKVAAGVFAANGVKVNIWPVLMPVPTVSFATRYLHTSAGVMVTASHNPSKYNGYKVYGADGCQITTEAAAEILAEIEKLDIFADVKTSDFDAGVANGSIQYIPDGPYGFYYLEDVGIVGCLFTFGLVGVFLFLTFITKGMKTIISGYKDRSIFSDSVVLGVFMFLVFTMPTLFLFDYARNGFLMFVLLFMTPKSERN